MKRIRDDDSDEQESGESTDEEHGSGADFQNLLTYFLLGRLTAPKV
jgi:hypothetical protein